LVGASRAFDYQEYIKPFCDKVSAKIFRLTLQKHRYTNLDYKLFLLRLSFIRSCTLRQAYDLAIEIGISENDAFLTYVLFTESAWFRRSVKRGRMVGSDSELLHFQGIHALFNEVYPALTKYIKYLTYTKLSFLQRSNNYDPEDFHSELMAKVLQSFYSIMPVSATTLHIINYLKRVAHNHTINLIKSHTSKKRGRRIDLGFDRNNQRQSMLLCISQNQAPVMTNAEGEQMDMLDVADDSHKKFELTFSIGQVLETYRSCRKKYRSLLLMLGTEDQEFTNWLRDSGLCSHREDNVTVQSRISPEEFNQYIAEFLNVPMRKMENFVGKLSQLVEC
jgi:DNA-directed RNA polymerase specialized sigma24 family protein